MLADWILFLLIYFFGRKNIYTTVLCSWAEKNAFLGTAKSTTEKIETPVSGRDLFSV